MKNEQLAYPKTEGNSKPAGMFLWLLFATLGVGYTLNTNASTVTLTQYEQTASQVEIEKLFPTYQIQTFEALFRVFKREMTFNRAPEGEGEEDPVMSDAYLPPVNERLEGLARMVTGNSHFFQVVENSRGTFEEDEGRISIDRKQLEFLRKELKEKKGAFTAAVDYLLAHEISHFIFQNFDIPAFQGAFLPAGAIDLNLANSSIEPRVFKKLNPIEKEKYIWDRFLNFTKSHAMVDAFAMYLLYRCHRDYAGGEAALRTLLRVSKASSQDKASGVDQSFLDFSIDYRVKVQALFSAQLKGLPTK